MKDKYILTAESVTEGHPDKLCDTIADSVLDACLNIDPDARVACEVLATAGKIIVAGEITVKDMPDIPQIVCETVRKTGYDCDYEVEVLVHDQSEDIADAVNCFGDVGAGDQGIVYGYACNETPMYLPLPVVLAHRVTSCLAIARAHDLLLWLLPDGKAQVSVEYEKGVPKRVSTVVVSAQHVEDVEEEELWDEIYDCVLLPAIGQYMDKETEVFINPGGLFVAGGFEADTGLTGRKLMVDTYGGLVPHGGGALSGKDGTKVDRSGSYMARFLAKNIVAAGLADKCTVSMAFAIGIPEPVAIDVDTHGTGMYPETVLEEATSTVFDLSVAGMIRHLKLSEPGFSRWCNYGHFTHPDAPWEETDCADLLRNACEQIMEESHV